MIINGIMVDVSKGFDVCVGAKVLRHFANYDDACAYAQGGRTRYIRYWGMKES